MILSANQLFSEAQVVTATAISENILDLGVPGTPYGGQAPLHQDIGKGCPIPVLIQVVADFATLDSLTVTVESSANEDMSSSTVLATEVIPVADLVAGKQTHLQVLPNGADQQYLATRYTVTGDAATGGGAITAGISMGNQTNLTGA